MTKALRFRVIYERKHREMRLPAPMKVKLPALPHGASWRRGVKVRKSYQNISEGSWIEDSRYLQPGTSADLSDISKVFETDDIFLFLEDITNFALSSFNCRLNSHKLFWNLHPHLYYDLYRPNSDCFFNKFFASFFNMVEFEVRLICQFFCNR